MKTVIGALIGALGSTLACWRLVLLLWVLNAALAAVIVAPLSGALDTAYAHNPLTASLPAQFDDGSFVDFKNVHGEALGASSDLAEIASLGWVVLWWLLSAAVLCRVGNKPGFRGHLEAVGRHAHRYLWLLVMTGLGLAVVAWLNNLLGGWVTSWLTESLDRGAGASTLGWSMTAKTLLSVLLMALVLGTGRIARLRVVKLNEKLMPLTWLRAAWSLLRSLPTVGLGMLLALLPLVLIIVVHRLVSEDLFTDGLLSGSYTSWRALAVGQVAQLLIQAALVYRFAVDARLWPLLHTAKSTAPEGTGASAGAAGDATPGPASGNGEPSSAPADTGDGAAPEQAAIQAPSHAPAVSAAGIVLASLSLLALAPALQQDPASPLAPALQQDPASVAAAPAQDLRPTATRSEQRNAYVIDVVLDPAARTATARERATFINTTKTRVDEVVLHLYAAAFGNTHSTWMSEGDPTAVTERGEELGGTLQIDSVEVFEVLDGGGLRAAQDGGLTPPDEVTIDDTLMRVRLGTPVPPGGRVTLDIRFVTRFPHVIARMGATGGHIDGMQWYPKFAAHDADGWNDIQFHRSGEFFSDFGSYDITFHHPEGFEFEATGLPGPRQTDDNGQVSVRYLAEDVHDFAFVACPHAERITDSFSFLGPPRRDVEIVYLCQPYALPKAQQVIEVVKRSLEFSGTYWMPYPYDRLVIDGLPHGLGGGMEYPMLFTISQRFPSHLDVLVDGTEDPAHVTVHEFGHEYWYGLLASNEFEEAWLDEGLNTWSTNTLMEYALPSPGQADVATFIRRERVREFLNGGLQMYVPGLGPSGLQDIIGWRRSPFVSPPPIPKSAKGRPNLLGYSVPRLQTLNFDDMGFDRFAWERDRYYDDADVMPLTTASRDITRGYGSLIYSKSALVLKTFQNHVGFDAMQQIMGRYTREWSFRHPTTDDFLAVLTEATDGVHDGWLHALIRTADTIDFSVEQVSTRFDPGPAGFGRQTQPGDPMPWTDAPDTPPEQADDVRPWYLAPLGEPDDRLALKPAADAAATDATNAADKRAGEGRWVSRWTVRQPGGIEAPVVIEARFADGAVLRETWDGKGGSVRYLRRTNARLLEVVVDPDRLFAIDLNLNNNGYRLDPAEDACRSLKFVSHFWAQSALDAWAVIF